MADQQDRQDDQQQRRGPVPVGTVAEEAARLLDALGGWVGTSGYAASDESARDESASDESASEESAPDESATDGSAPDRTEPGGARAPRDETAAHPAGHCDQCGAANRTGQAVTCQWCPVCQGIGLLRSVRPETVDRLADLAGALATALRDVATHSRGAGAAQDAPRDAQEATHRSARVQDITIDDEDQGSATR